MIDKNTNLAPDASLHRADAEYARELLEKLRAVGLSERAVARAISVTDRVFRNYKDKGGMPYTVQFALESLLATRNNPADGVHEPAVQYHVDRAPFRTVWHRASDRPLGKVDVGKLVVGRDRFGCAVVGTLELDGFGLVLREFQSQSTDRHSMPVTRVELYTLLDPPPAH